MIGLQEQNINKLTAQVARGASDSGHGNSLSSPLDDAPGTMSPAPPELVAFVVAEYLPVRNANFTVSVGEQLQAE